MKTGYYGKTLRRSIDFYNTALKAAAERPGSKTFEYNDWEFSLDTALGDFSADVRDGKLNVAVEART